VGLSIVLSVLLIDQASKWAAVQWLASGEEIRLLPILSLFRVANEGIAFSLFSGAGGLVLVLATFAITVAVLIIWRQAPEGGRVAAIGYALITGGALGNLVDRARFGHVIDFLLLHFGAWTLFVFNLADVALTIGPLLLAYVYLARPR
jgi:signal peptidase II